VPLVIEMLAKQHMGHFYGIPCRITIMVNFRKTRERDHQVALATPGCNNLKRTVCLPAGLRSGQLCDHQLYSFLTINDDNQLQAYLSGPTPQMRVENPTLWRPMQPLRQLVNI